MSNPYKHGLEVLNAVIQPTSDRVLLRAIMATDDSTIQMARVDTRQAVCHEVVRAGPDVKNLDVGMHVLHISTAGDGLDPTEEARFLLVREEDVVAYWWPKDAEQAAALIGEG